MAVVDACRGQADRDVSQARHGVTIPNFGRTVPYLHEHKETQPISVSPAPFLPTLILYARSHSCLRGADVFVIGAEIVEKPLNSRGAT